MDWVVWTGLSVRSVRGCSVGVRVPVFGCVFLVGVVPVYLGSCPEVAVSFTGRVEWGVVRLWLVCWSCFS
jgi:hypothetical protein